MKAAVTTTKSRSNNDRWKKVSVGLVAAVIGCGLLAYHYSESSLMITNLAVTPSKKFTVTVLNLRDEGRDPLKLVNTKDGKVIGEYPLINVELAKKDARSTVSVPTTDRIGDMVCLCATGEDAWFGKLVSLTVPLYPDSRSETVTLAGSPKGLNLDTDGGISSYPCWRFRVNMAQKKLISMAGSDSCAVKEYEITIKTDNSASSMSRNSMFIFNVRDFDYTEKKWIGRANSELGGSIVKRASLSHGLGNAVCICIRGDDGFRGYLTELKAPLFDDSRDAMVTLTGVSEVKMLLSTNDKGFSKCWRFNVVGWGVDPSSLKLADGGGVESCSMHSATDSLAALQGQCAVSASALDQSRNQAMAVRSQTNTLNTQILSNRNQNWGFLLGSQTIDSFADATDTCDSPISNLDGMIENVERISANNNRWANNLNRLASEVSKSVTSLRSVQISIPLEEDILGKVGNGIKNAVSSVASAASSAGSLASSAASAVGRAAKEGLSRADLTGAVRALDNLEGDVKRLASGLKKFALSFDNFAESIDTLPNAVKNLANQVANIGDVVKCIVQSQFYFARFGDDLMQKVKSLMLQNSKLSEKLSKQSDELANSQDQTATAVRQATQTAIQLKTFTEATSASIGFHSRELDGIKDSDDDLDQQMVQLAAMSATLTQLNSGSNSNGNQPSLQDVSNLLKQISLKVEKLELKQD